jgi:hypothetical protein
MIKTGRVVDDQIDCRGVNDLERRLKEVNEVRFLAFYDARNASDF